MSNLKRLSIATALLLAAGCSGGGGSNAVPKAPAQPGTPVTPQSKKITVKIHIPAPPKQTSGRHRAYVSPFTAYALVSETDSGFTEEYTQVGTDLSSTSSACTTDNDGSGSRTCTVQIDATPSQSGSATDYFEFDTYSTSEANAIAAPNAALSAAVPTTNHLGSARTQATITLDAANTINASLDGVVASYSVVPSTISGDGSQPITGSYSLTALDSSGDVIIAGSADPYTDGVNYPLSFTETDNPTALPDSNTNPPFLIQPPGGPDGSIGATLFSQSADYLSVFYNPNSGASSYYDTLTFTAPSNSPLNATPATALFAPIFLDGSGSTFSQNDTNPLGGVQNANTSSHRVAPVRGARHRATSESSTGNNYPIVNFTASTQSVTITPTEYTGSGPAQMFTYAPSSGCMVGSHSTVAVTPSSSTPATSFTVAPTEYTQRYNGNQNAYSSATDANGQAITTCSITFTDTNGNSALLEVTNTETTSTVAIDPGALVTSGSNDIYLYDTSQNPLAQIVDYKAELNQAEIVEKDGLANIYYIDSAYGNDINVVSPTEYRSNSGAKQFVSESGGSNDNGSPFFSSLAYHETDTTAHTGTLIAGDQSYGRVYFFNTSKVVPGTANYIQLPKSTRQVAVVSVAFDPTGNIYAADSNNNVIQEFPAGTTVNGSTPTTILRTIHLVPQPLSIAVDAAENVFVAVNTSDDGTIYEYSATNSATPAVTITAPDCADIISVAVESGTSGNGDTVFAGCSSGTVYLATNVTPSSGNTATANPTMATGFFVAF